MLKSYIDYLKDNPKGYWFRAKRFGWGWIPATRQGWLVFFVYIVTMTIVFRRTDAQSHSVSDTLYGAFIPFVVLTVILIALCHWKGEPPRWSWNMPKKKI